jgi:MFS family permease
MKNGYGSIVVLMLAVFLLSVGNGIVSTLVPLRAKIDAFDVAQIGLLGSFYFGGMLAGSVFATAFIRKVGHIRAIAAAIILVTATTLTLPLIVSLPVWLALRFLAGAAFAAFYAAIEAWLQGRASNAVRGLVLSFYSLAIFSGSGAGNLLLGLAPPTAFVLFSLSAIAMCLAVLPLMVAETDPPPVPESGELRLMTLLRESPIGFVGALMIGLANGPFWSQAPLFAGEKGLTSGETGTFMAALTIGAAILQFPVARLSDLIDRRLVLVVVGFVTVIAEFAIGLATGLRDYHLLLLTGFFLGGAISSQYYVIAAHANDRASASEAARISAAMLLLYCIGAMIGPSTAGLLMKQIGASGLLIHNGFVHLVLALFVAYRMLVRPPPPPKAEDVEAMLRRAS